MSVSDSGDERLRTAVLGTGIMGSAMTRNLLAAGLPTTVWDRSAGATMPLAEAGALVAASAAEAVRDARVVITMLPTPDAVSSVVFDGGVAGAFGAGAAWAQMGTIGAADTAEIAGRLGQLRPDVLFVDAPVSGSKGPAEKGQLLILASGPSAAEAITRPVFSAIGRKTLWLGEAVQRLGERRRGGILRPRRRVRLRRAGPSPERAGSLPRSWNVPPRSGAGHDSLRGSDKARSTRPEVPSELLPPGAG